MARMCCRNWRHRCATRRHPQLGWHRSRLRRIGLAPSSPTRSQTITGSTCSWKDWVRPRSRLTNWCGNATCQPPPWPPSSSSWNWPAGWNDIPVIWCPCVRPGHHSDQVVPRGWPRAFYTGSMKVVVVESPAKARTINRYLGSDYTVVASYGHVRDLPAKDGSVLPDADFAMSWEVDGKSEKHMKAIVQAVRNADGLFLATDPDREGEAISWHVREVLNSRRALKHLDVKRVVFNEVTRGAVLDAFSRPREIDRELVDAYLARRALDYLVGFTLSPVLWRKLPGSRSAGRVQSVALRLICEREAEIEAFKPREYWTIEVEFKTEAGQVFTARLTHLDGKRLDRFDLDTEDKARAAAEAILRAPGSALAEIDSRQVRRNPFPPFTTSTLQQESSRKLGLSANRTMQIAQRLYEGVDLAGETVGLITYMRTDGVAISAEAIAAARQLIGSEFGARYVPDAPRVYRSPAKNAQEAHEAIRPTDLARKPADVARYLDREQLRLYELIWKRTVASQMASALLEQVAVDIADATGRLRLRANGSVILFDGFLALYQEDRDDTPDAQLGTSEMPEGEGG